MMHTIGYIPQSLGLVKNVSVLDNILIGALPRLNRMQSIMKQFPEDEINVYPNPSEGRFNIEIESLPSSYTLNIFDQIGRLVHQENNILAVNCELNLDRLDNGMYHLILEFEDRRYQAVHKKLIKH